MADAPQQDNFIRFADYVLDTYVSPDALFPPHMWAWIPGDTPHTNNAAESFHGRLSSIFEGPHPNIYLFVGGLKQIQTLSDMSLRSLQGRPVVRRAEAERRKFVHGRVDMLTRGIITNYDYLKCVSYRHLPITDL